MGLIHPIRGGLVTRMIAAGMMSALATLSRSSLLTQKFNHLGNFTLNSLGRTR